MLTYDFSPLFRSTVGFDRLARLAESALHADQAAVSYPPYNIETTGEDTYRISMAVAGFKEDELSIETHEDTLTVSGSKTVEDGDVTYLHRGIAGRDFLRRFNVADHVKVTSAYLSDGLLVIGLVREVPEALKPRHIEIKVGTPGSLVDKAKKLIEGSSKKKAA
ncbi:MAG TPA: Hsp20 family protein [Rhodospirillales bacterium]|nr:Hsp20 family protein [Rhodospirillales bacterium]